MSDIEQGSIVIHNGRRRVVVDVAVQDAEAGEGRHARDGRVIMAVLRLSDDDPGRRVDDQGGDIDLTAAYADELTVIGHV